MPQVISGRDASITTPVLAPAPKTTSSGFRSNMSAKSSTHNDVALCMGEAIRPPNPEELEKMSAFKDFIESLDLDDFGKTKT